MRTGRLPHITLLEEQAEKSLNNFFISSLLAYLEAEVINTRKNEQSRQTWLFKPVGPIQIMRGLYKETITQKWSIKDFPSRRAWQKIVWLFISLASKSLPWPSP